MRLLEQFVLAIASAIALAAPLAAQTSASATGSVVLITDRALDGRGGVLRGARIGIAKGKIVSLAARGGARTIDLRGYTVLPGWIDTHVHLASHFDRAGRIATDTEPPGDAAVGLAL